MEISSKLVLGALNRLSCPIASVPVREVRFFFTMLSSTKGAAGKVFASNAIAGYNLRSRSLATQVPMSLLEKNKFINYEMMEANLKIVRDR